MTSTRPLLLLATVVVLVQLSRADTTIAAALSLPAFKASNITQYLELLNATKASLEGVARSAAEHLYKARPVKCPNGRPLVVCSVNPCTAGKCGASQVCTPNYCGLCEAKCINVSVPLLSSLKVPSLPELNIKLPNITLPKGASPCPANSVVDLSTTVLIGNTILKAAAGGNVSCKACAAGSEAGLGALKCMLCAPGYARASNQAACKKCAAGSYAGSFGSKACVPCPAGSFAPLSGAFACIKCPLGFKAAAAGATKCTFVGY